MWKGDFLSVGDGVWKRLSSRRWNPKIFGGILADRKNNNHLEDLDKIDGKTIDLIVVNLYPFVDEAVKNNLPMEKAIEYIDIGRPSMLRAAAKNFNDVTIVSSIADIPSLAKELKRTNGYTTSKFREQMSAKAFGLTSYYDAVVSNWLNNKLNIKY